MGTFQSKYTGAQIEARLDAVTSKQDALVSGQNIKTVNNESILGPGNITIQGGGGYVLEGEYENEVFALTEGTFSDAYAQLEDGKSAYLRFTSDETGMSGLYLIAEAVYYNSTTIVFALDLPDANYIISVNSNGLGSVTRDGLQPRLVSGTNIKTINNQPVLGSGNINIEAGETDSSMSPTSENPVQNKVIYAQLQTKVGSETVDNIVELTKAQYDALATKDAGTLYIITDAGEADGYVSITGFEQTQSSSVSGGSNVWTVYLSNGQSFSLTVKNGEQGNTGSSVAYPYELINNLTTDDATKGLSAAQGVVLQGEIIDLDLQINGRAIIQKDIIWGNGYVNNNGEVKTSSSSIFSQPFLLKKNETIRYKTSTSYRKAVVRLASGGAISVGDTLDITATLIDYSDPNVDASYTAEEDMYIVVSLNGANYSLSFEANKEDSIAEEITALQSKATQHDDEISQIENDLASIKGGTVEISPDWSLGYVSQNEVKASSGQSSFCQPFKLAAGQVVKFGTYATYAQAICVVASGDAIEVGDILAPIASVNKSDGQYGYVEYEATDDCYVICSGYTSSKNVWIISDGLEGRIDAIDERVDALESAAAEYYGDYTQFIGFKRAMQQVLLKWTPKNPVPKRDGTAFPANVEVSGLVYSETMETDKRVGWDVSLLTFMTAVNNPYSLLYTENISASRSQSAYGIIYHGDGNSGAYYGSVCNTFAMLGVCNDVSYTTPQVWEERTDLFFKVYDQSIRGLELMDLVGKSGHVLLVTKLVKDKYGVNVGVHLSEEAGTVAVTRPVMNETQFASFLLANGYTVMRFKEQYKNILYTPSPFVAVLDEVPEEYTYNNDICTIYGDYASILEGDLLHINYTKGAYTQMKIYKDDNLVATISLSSDSSVHDIDLSEYGFTYGKYKACLSDGTNDSAFTHWELIRIEMSLSGDELTFSVNGGKALYWDWQKQSGGSYIPHLLDESQTSGGTINVSESGKGDYNYCIKVHAQGDYGRVAKRIIV